MALLERETIVNATQLQRNQKQVLDDAQQHPVTIQRDFGAVTIVNREEFLASRAAVQVSEYVNAVAVMIAARLAGKAATYPVELSWLKHFDEADTLDFVEEFVGAARAAHAGQRSWDDLPAILRQWERSAHAAQDSTLRSRFAELRGSVTRVAKRKTKRVRS